MGGWTDFFEGVMEARPWESCPSRALEQRPKQSARHASSFHFNGSLQGELRELAAHFDVHLGRINRLFALLEKRDP
jgi:hypothetical protein